MEFFQSHTGTRASLSHSVLQQSKLDGIVHNGLNLGRTRETRAAAAATTRTIVVAKAVVETTSTAKKAKIIVKGIHKASGSFRGRIGGSTSRR